MEDMDVDEADFQQLLGELTDAKNNLAQHNGDLPSPRFWDHLPECSWSRS